MEEMTDIQEESKELDLGSITRALPIETNIYRFIITSNTLEKLKENKISHIRFASACLENVIFLTVFYALIETIFYRNQMHLTYLTDFIRNCPIFKEMERDKKEVIASCIDHNLIMAFHIQGINSFLINYNKQEIYNPVSEIYELAATAIFEAEEFPQTDQDKISEEYFQTFQIIAIFLNIHINLHHFHCKDDTPNQTMSKEPSRETCIYNFSPEWKGERVGINWDLESPSIDIFMKEDIKQFAIGVLYSDENILNQPSLADEINKDALNFRIDFGIQPTNNSNSNKRSTENKPNRLVPSKNFGEFLRRNIERFGKCCLTGKRMREPSFLRNGNSYEKETVEYWVKQNKRPPGVENFEESYAIKDIYANRGLYKLLQGLQVELDLQNSVLKEKIMVNINTHFHAHQLADTMKHDT